MLQLRDPHKSRALHQYPLIVGRKNLLYFRDPKDQEWEYFLKPWTLGSLSFEQPQILPPYPYFPSLFGLPYLMVALGTDLPCLPIVVKLRCSPFYLRNTPIHERHYSLVDQSGSPESMNRIVGRLLEGCPCFESKCHTPCLSDQDSHTNNRDWVGTHT